MSAEARQALVTSGHLIFTDDTQKSDLLDSGKTQTWLIALLQDITAKGFHLGVTAVRTDHSDDAYLGLHSHANGYAMDCWPTTGNNLDWLDAGDPNFQRFLEAAAGSPYLYQIGLAGSADTAANRVAAGPTVFSDDGADHVHLGSKST